MAGQVHLWENLRHYWTGTYQEFQINLEIWLEVFFQPQWTFTQVPTVTALSIGDLFFKSLILTIIGTRRNNGRRKSQAGAALREKPSQAGSGAGWRASSQDSFIGETALNPVLSLTLTH